MQWHVLNKIKSNKKSNVDFVAAYGAISDMSGTQKHAPPTSVSNEEKCFDIALMKMNKKSFSNSH